MQRDDELVDTIQLAKMLGVNKATIKNWHNGKVVNEGFPKGFKITNRLRWRLSEINAWLEERSKA